MPADTHQSWLDGLPIKWRLVYDRAFGKHWWDRPDTDYCRQAARADTEKRMKEREQ